MKSIAIIYWSGTGNTQQMAIALMEGAKTQGAEVFMKEVRNASVEDVLNADAVALGCPSMGCEVLEEEEMEPFIQALENENMKGKPLVLFGSFDWGDGQWMTDWSDRMSVLGVNLVADGLKIHTEPDEEGLTICRELGEKLAATL